MHDQKRDREFEVEGMPDKEKKGFVDYVLWGDDRLPLAVVEAKRTRRDVRVGQQQAKLYADCLEAKFGRCPVIFYSNGYEHWLWDDVTYAPRAVQGFDKKSELELLLQGRAGREPLGKADISTTVIERYYQTRAIRRIAETFKHDKVRKALVVIAEFLSNKNIAANQIEFGNLIVNHLTEHGVMNPSLLYESPFTDITPRGPDGLFTSAQVDQLMAILDRVRAAARVA